MTRREETEEPFDKVDSSKSGFVVQNSSDRLTKSVTIHTETKTSVVGTY